MWESIRPQYILFDMHSWVAGAQSRPLKRMQKKTQTIYSSECCERKTFWAGCGRNAPGGRRRRKTNWAPREQGGGNPAAHWPLMLHMARGLKWFHFQPVKSDFRVLCKQEARMAGLRSYLSIGICLSGLGAQRHLRQRHVWSSPCIWGWHPRFLTCHSS